jgi:hypothetical protein
MATVAAAPSTVPISRKTAFERVAPDRGWEAM